MPVGSERSVVEESGPSQNSMRRATAFRPTTGGGRRTVPTPGMSTLPDGAAEVGDAVHVGIEHREQAFQVAGRRRGDERVGDAALLDRLDREPTSGVVALFAVAMTAISIRVFRRTAVQ